MNMKLFYSQIVSESPVLVPTGSTAREVVAVEDFTEDPPTLSADDES